MSIVLAFASAANAQAAHHARINKEEQQVYEAVFQSQLGDGAGDQFVAVDLTTRPAAFGACVDGVNFDKNAPTPTATKSFEGVTFRRAGLHFIDRQSWQPDTIAVVGPGGVGLEAAVKKAFAQSLITLSEIRFSKDRRDAILTMDQQCGGLLCGGGTQLKVHKQGGAWSVKTCGGYIL